MYGYVSQRHYRKLSPWLARLESATAGLREDIAANDPSEALKSLEDVNFWRGRIVCDGFGANYAAWKSDPSLGPKMIKAFTESETASYEAQRYLLARRNPPSLGNITSAQLRRRQAALRKSLQIYKQPWFYPTIFAVLALGIAFTIGSPKIAKRST